MTKTSGYFRLLGMSLVLVACATPQGKPIDPEERSAQSHREQAEVEAAKAAEQRARYTPNAAEPSSFRDRSGDSDLGKSIPLQNPTEKHLTQARWHRAHSKAHFDAAKKLEAFEDEACRGVPAKERAACPLVGAVTGIRDVAGGVAIDLSPTVDAAAAIAVMRCHYAYARTRGFAPGASSCPLYVRGLMIEQAGLHTVEITSKDESTVTHVRQTARDEVVPTH